MIATKYLLFALASSSLNLLCQYLSFMAYNGVASIYLAMFFGTGAGLVAKYILDKKFIFQHKPETKIEDLKVFIAYTFTGVFTTFIFWGTELGFDAVFDHEWAKYIGAIVGLSIGYTVKYRLDKKHVFTHPRKNIEE